MRYIANFCPMKIVSPYLKVYHSGGLGYNGVNRYSPAKIFVTIAPE